MNASSGWSHKSTVVLVFSHIQYLYLMYSVGYILEGYILVVAYVLVSSQTQVQLQILLNRD